MDPSDEATEGGLPEDLLLEDQSAGATEIKEDPDSKKGIVRKRTKTGCLTCRRRRIKCDEGKPTCNNCIKSKRPCDGYNQRLTFKDPINPFHHAPHFSHPVYHHQQSVEAMLGPQLSASHPKSSSSQGPLPVIAPKPPSVDFSGAMPFQFSQGYQGQPGPSTPIPPVGFSPTQFSPTQFSPTQFSPTQFSPQHPLVSPFYPPPAAAPADAQSQLEADDFFQTLPPVGPHDATDFIKQEPLVGEQVHPLSPASRYLPPKVEYAGAQTAGPAPQEPGYWNSDDEASMADSDDDDDALFENQDAHLESNDLGIQVARRANALNDLYGTQLRTFAGFVDANGVLATYMPSSTNSPLNDSRTAAVFWYFVNVTGPSISLYERRPFDPSPMFQGQPVPKVRQHIWTYTFPIISLNHPALLQAILALGSLQMAKLQGVPPTASMKHYHLSLRRIAKNYRSPHRRTQAATLAATLLLGFYEIWNSDHDKWCKHMWGARAILKEIPLREMTKSVLALKWEERHALQESQNAHQQPDGLFAGVDDGDPDITHVDMDLLSQISGSPVTYEDYGYVYGDGHQQSTGWHTERDVENFGHLADLYWWYCKMDVYQSILGGTRLFMEYDLWTQCVPRGPIGRIDAIFGTYDHLMLLQGRLANFAALDLARKRQARKAESAGKGHHQSPPMFPGLIPSEGKITVPTGFSPPPEPSPPSENPDDIDLEASTATALREWEAIRHAFDVFRSKLGPDFDPMGPEMGPPRQTPFGPARTYRTYSIAGIWMGYYMGQVVLHRAHPSMPPVAMMAAGMAAQNTGRYAYEIGMIAAGLADEDCDNMTEVSTSLGAAFIECCFCLFVAGVQYQDPVHRHWTIKRLHNIARLTGWQSARQIADGCESAWTKAAQFGRGAPYQRSPDLDLLVPPSVWTNPRRIDHKIRELDRDEGKYVLTKSEQAHYALGLLSVEHDLDRLELGDKG